MAEFLTTSGTSHHIETIIMEARIEIVLVSPYLQISKTFYERLKDASNQNVSIKIIYGKDELKPNEKNSLADIQRVELYYFENLHAKCYYNESRMVITSMNMYEFSEKTNREMGVLIDRNIDKELYAKAVAETMSILKSSEPTILKKSDRRTYAEKKSIGNHQKQKLEFRGYCIRCETRIEYDPNKPFCVECFSVWSRYGNLDYQESVCHRCGEYETVSMGKPQCYDCYLAYRQEQNNTF